ncbi:MAG TPA: hypothetical protein PK777_12840 [Thermoguttaceae bacterium]|nr:hypothetical protein [Thermoguttaceae bacterium]HPP53832.1 hypothetical protein [Thermoguttaceae bacterium]
MWRAFFQAVGIFLFIVGVECLAIEQAVLRIHDPPTSMADPVGPAKVFRPTEWMPFSLMATGAITLIYSFTIPGWAKKEG